MAHVQSHRRGIPSWRTSALASMLSECTTVELQSTGSMATLVDDVLIGPPGRFGRISELEIWAGTTRAGLRQKMG